MSEDYRIQLSVKKGADMVNVRAETARELQAIVDEAKGMKDLAPFFSGSAAKAAGTGPVAGVTETTVTGQLDRDLAQADRDLAEGRTVSVDEALANITKHLGPGTEKAATAAQILVAAKKSGKSKQELEGISEVAAKALIAGGE